MSTSRDRRLLVRTGAALAAIVGALAGVRAGLAVTVLCILAIDYFFLAPQLTLRVMLLADAVALALFGAVAVPVSWLIARPDERRRLAEKQALEAAALASLLERQVGSLREEMADRERLNPMDPRSGRARPRADSRGGAVPTRLRADPLHVGVPVLPSLGPHRTGR